MDEISFFSDGETYWRDIRRKVGGKERVERIELRPLMAGDRADLQDAVRFGVTDEEGDETGATELRVGTMRLLTVTRALVSWTLPKAISLSSVRALHPDVFSQIYDEVSWGEIPPEPSEQELAGDPLPDTNGSSEHSEDG
jgi:hypothetical protein